MIQGIDPTAFRGPGSNSFLLCGKNLTAVVGVFIGEEGYWVSKLWTNFAICVELDGTFFFFEPYYAMVQMYSGVEWSPVPNHNNSDRQNT